MPYYVHPKERSADTNEDSPFTDRQSAFDYLKIAHTQQTHTITFLVSESEISQWHTRERRRFRDGQYIRTPWAEDGYDQPTLQDHFAHMSTETPGMIAYTPDVEKGIQDRQTRVRPGKYLEQFGYVPNPAVGITKEMIDGWIARCQAFADTSGLQLATSAEDVAAVYIGGPSSCMDGEHFENMRVDMHPATVYSHPSDLAVAYYGDLHRASQRCVVWPERKIYSRIYGTGPLALILKTAGYTVGNLNGAKIRLINVDRGILLPYIDNVDGAGVISENFIRLGSGCLDTCATCGYVSDDEPYETCLHCDRQYNPDDEGEDGYCQVCCDNRWVCEHCDRQYFNDRSHKVNGVTWCERCVENNTLTCQDENCSETWIDVDEFTREEITERTKHHTADLCRSCAARYIWCDVCEESYDTDDKICSKCDRLPRCDKTADLLTVNLADFDLPNDGRFAPYFNLTEDYTVEPNPNHGSMCLYPAVSDCPTVCDRCHGESINCPPIRGESELNVPSVTVILRQIAGANDSPF